MNLDMMNFSVELTRVLVYIKIFEKKYYVELQSTSREFFKCEIKKEFPAIAGNIEEKRCFDCDRRILEETGFISLPWFGDILCFYSVEKNFETNKRFFFRCYLDDEVVLRKEVKQNTRLHEAIKRKIKK